MFDAIDIENPFVLVEVTNILSFFDNDYLVKLIEEV